MWKTCLGRLRLVGLLEGLSFVLLVGIAMPLKYAANTPEPVQVIGMAHGILFMLYLLAIVHVAIALPWSNLRIFGSFFAAFLPFGPFVMERYLRRDEAALAKVQQESPA